ncbi:hypothetical protein FRB99_001059 [Tulasnella sp. 403]|nr:hypothetical protein FRB99_001059 [Tulasnella sp. 403]
MSAREDAVRVKKLVNQSYTAREYRNQQYGGPSPSQRAPHSVQRAICRYFGENVDTSDAAIATTYCQKMCDVCKNPEKTRRSKAALSSEEFVMTQVPRLEKEAARDDGSEDEDGYPSTKGYARIGSFGLESDRTAFRTLPPSFRPLGISALQARPQILPNLPKSNILGNTPRSSKGFWASDGPANGVMVKSSSLADSPSTLVDGHIDHFADDAMASPPGLLKRESDITNEPATASTKRARVGNALSELDTMPIRRGSAQRPFRPPFKTPPAAEVIEIKDSEDEDEKIAVKKPSHRKPPSSVSSTSNSRNVASTTSSPDRRPIQTSDVTSSPVKFDTETGDVDGALSKKIPVNIRERTLETFRRVLHKNLMVGFQAEVFWGKLKALDIPQEDRSGIVLDCVKQLEFLIMCYSVTTEGYRERSDARLQALRRFVNETDAIDSWMTTNQRTGKGKANTVCNEEVEEVMRILCKLTNDWKAKRKGKSRACPPQNTRRGWAEPEASSPSETGNTDIQEDGDASVMIIDGDDDDGRERSQEWDFGKTVLSSDWEI